MSEINPGLAALSLLVAVMSVYTALDLTARLRAASTRVANWWLLGGALHLGGGLWAMHQIAATCEIALLFTNPHLRTPSHLVAMEAFAILRNAEANGIRGQEQASPTWPATHRS